MGRIKGIGSLGIGLALLLAACSSAPDSEPSQAGPIETQIAGESFSSLQVSPEHLTGVFSKDGRELVFDVEKSAGAFGLRLSTTSGDVLFEQVVGPTGLELHVGQSFSGSLAHDAAKGAPARPGTEHSPDAFQGTGDLQKAYDSLKGTELELLPNLTAALGRLGYRGDNAPITLPLHFVAMHLTEKLALKLDTKILQATNEIVKSGGVASKLTGGVAAAPEVHTEGLVIPPISCPASRKPPCPAGQYAPTSGPLANCCVASPAPPSYCASGVGREHFGTDPGLSTNPCADNCRGMCGPGCDPWYWVCGDYGVHTACWNHDSAICPTTLTFWGVTIPNPAWATCETEYWYYTEWIFTDTAALGMCANNSTVDSWTTPWDGMWTEFPTYYVQ